MSRIQKFSKKKLLTPLLTASLLIPTVGGTALASSDTLQDKIKSIVLSYVTPLLPEVEKELADYRALAVQEVSTFVAGLDQSIQSEINSHKAQLLQAGKEQIDEYKENVISDINNKKNQSVSEGVAQLEKIQSEQVEQAKNDMNEVVAELEVPSSSDSTTSEVDNQQ